MVWATAFRLSAARRSLGSRIRTELSCEMASSLKDTTLISPSSCTIIGEIYYNNLSYLIQYDYRANSLLQDHITARSIVSTDVTIPGCHSAWVLG